MFAPSGCYVVTVGFVDVRCGQWCVVEWVCVVGCVLGWEGVQASSTDVCVVEQIEEQGMNLKRSR